MRLLTRLCLGFAMAALLWAPMATAAMTADELKEKLAMELFIRQHLKAEPFEEILPALGELLRKDEFPNEKARFLAWRTLVYGNDIATWNEDKNTIADAKVVELAIAGLRSEQSDVAELCARALGRVEGKEKAKALAALKDFAKMKSPAGVAAAQGALKDKDLPETRKANEALARFLGGKNAAHVKAAADALGVQAPSTEVVQQAALDLLKRPQADLASRYDGQTSREAFQSSGAITLEARRSAAWVALANGAGQRMLALKPKLDAEGKEAVNLALLQGATYFPYNTRRTLGEEWPKAVGQAFAYLRSQEKPLEVPQLGGLGLVLLLHMDTTLDLPEVSKEIEACRKQWASAEATKSFAAALDRAKSFYEKAYEVSPQYKELKLDLRKTLSGIETTEWRQSSLQMTSSSIDLWLAGAQADAKTAEKLRKTIEALESIAKTDAIMTLRREHMMFSMVP